METPRDWPRRALPGAFCPGNNLPGLLSNYFPVPPPVPFSSPGVGLLPALPCGSGAARSRFRVCWRNLEDVLKYDSKDPAEPSWAARSGRRVGEAWLRGREPAPRAEPQGGWPSYSWSRPGWWGCERLPLARRTQKEGCVQSRPLALGDLDEATWRSPWGAVARRPVLCSLPVLLSFLLVTSFLLSSGGSEVSPGRRWGAGSRALVCLPPVLTTFLANPPSSAWLVSASAALVRGADGDAEVAEGWWRGQGKRQPRSWLRPQDAESELILHLSVFLVIVAALFPGNKLELLWSGVMFISLPFPPSPPFRTL